MDLQIKGKIFTHHIINQLTDNIIGIDFMHKHKLHYNVQTRQAKIASIDIDQIVATKEQILPALASTVITAKYKGSHQKCQLHCQYLRTLHTNDIRHACNCLHPQKQ